MELDGIGMSGVVGGVVGEWGFQGLIGDLVFGKRGWEEGGRVVPYISHRLMGKNGTISQFCFFFLF